MMVCNLEYVIPGTISPVNYTLPFLQRLHFAVPRTVCDGLEGALAVTLPYFSIALIFCHFKQVSLSQTVKLYIEMNLQWDGCTRCNLCE